MITCLCMRDTMVCVMLGHWHASNSTVFFFRQVPHHRQLMILPPPGSSSVAASSRRSAKGNTARDIEQQEEELQPPSVQQDLAESSSNTTPLRPKYDLVGLQTFVNSRLCGGSLHPRDIQLLAQQLLQVRPSSTDRFVILCGKPVCTAR